MAHVDEQRVARVLDALEAQHPGAQLLVNDPWSIYYLTGFYADMFERFCGVLLARDDEPVILVNALHQLPEYDNARVAYHTDTDVVTDAIAREVDPTKPLGIDTVMRSGFLMPLMDRHAASEFFLGDFAVTAARTYKDAAEQELMRVSSAANDAVMADAIKLVEYLTAAERQVALAGAAGTVPAGKSAGETWKGKHADQAAFLAGVEYSQPVPSASGTSDIIANFDNELPGLAGGDPAGILNSAQVNLQAVLS